MSNKGGVFWWIQEINEGIPSVSIYDKKFFGAWCNIKYFLINHSDQDSYPSCTWAWNLWRITSMPPTVPPQWDGKIGQPQMGWSRINPPLGSHSHPLQPSHCIVRRICTRKTKLYSQIHLMVIPSSRLNLFSQFNTRFPQPSSNNCWTCHQPRGGRCISWFPPGTQSRHIIQTEHKNTTPNNGASGKNLARDLAYQYTWQESDTLYCPFNY